MPIRNPFARRPGAHSGGDSLRPEAAQAQDNNSGFEKVETVGSRTPSALSVTSRKSQDNGEYKMSVVNDSGIYLPPSPPQRDNPFNHRRLLSASRASTDTRNSADLEPFPISRESFDSYRRSFDVSAKSPIRVSDPAPRQSLDSARFPRLPRSAVGDHKFSMQPATTEETFEEVGLGDDHKQQQTSHAKKRNIFARFADNDSALGSNLPASTNMTRFFSGRKRGQSGQGAELGPMERSDHTPPVETPEIRA